MKQKKLNYVVVIIGIIILATGLYLLKANSAPQGIMKSLPYICIGIGCGLFGQGMGEVISKLSMKNSPEIQKQLDIETNDERNIAIANRAKSKAFDIMIFVYGAMILSLALMNINMVTLLLLVFAYLFIQGCAIYYRCKYEKEM